jgi:FkbM family methyltransferase
MQWSRQWKSLIGGYIAKRELRYPLDIELRGGGSLRIEDWDELSTFWHVFCCREYDLPPQCKSIVDLGANIGAFTLWASRRFPDAKIVSVEPFPSTFERLAKTIDENALGNRVKAQNIAVNGADGVVKFDATVGRRSYCRSMVEDAGRTESIEVPCLSLSSLLDHHGLPEIDCLKMDVEGGEYAILRGASPETLRRIRVITMEFHDAAKSPELWQKLEQSGFRRQRIVHAGWSGLATFVRRDDMAVKV